MFNRIQTAICLAAVVLLLLGASCLCRAAESASELEEGFIHPPDSARPWVFWFWLNGNITREGITEDLEAMKSVGIGGVIIMEVDQGAPQGPVDFMSPQWRQLFKHMVTEAQRLGLEVNMNNDAGWNGSGGPWIKPEQSMQKLVWSDTNLQGPRRRDVFLPQPQTTAGFYRDIAVLAFPTTGEFRIDNIEGKAAYKFYRKIELPSQAKLPLEMIIDRASIINLTAKTDKQGYLTWDVPAGKWTLMRIGHTSTGITNHPAPKSGRGLECDKLSKKGIEAQFAGMMRPLIADAGNAAGKSLVATHIDSWENRSQNWTAQMLEEFRKRRGYDMLAFLPVFSGRVVESLEVSERFLWDLRQTISELVVENYAARLAELAKEHGLRLSIEAYDGPCDDLTYAGRADEPMSEFWIGRPHKSTNKKMASAAHIYGKRIIGSEAFTADNREKWLYHPAMIKALGDQVFCEGVNRFVIHRYAMQPWSGYKPGMTMGPWGLHYERTLTWWQQSSAWNKYLSRCQFLLRQGLFAADICYLQAEAAQQRFQPHNPSGYDYDNCTPEVVLTRMSVKNGRIVLPDGMSYRLLVLPQVTTMTPPLLRKIKELVEAGATVLGSRPLKSPSLSDYPNCDDQIKQLADELWADCDGQAVKEHAYGKGKIVSGLTPEETLAKMGVQPDFTAAPFIRWIHRSVGETEIYFVASDSNQPTETVCNFRVTGKWPELWQPETGQIERVASYQEADGITSIPIRLEPSGSVFVVFSQSAGTFDPVVSVMRDGQVLSPSPELKARVAIDKAAYDLLKYPKRTRDVPLTVETWQPGSYELKTASGRTLRCQTSELPQPLEITGPWQLRFAPNWGAPEQVTLEKLISWSEHSDPGIKHFSGTATYTKTIHVPAELLGKNRHLYLDLGKVQIMAQIKLNGKDLGILWKPPFRADITDAVKAGKNALEVKVVNVWVNRMIGDEKMPEDSPRKENGTLKEWPQWLQEGKPSPTGRYTFTTWRLWKADDPLIESGLIGPVTLHPTVKIPAKPLISK